MISCNRGIEEKSSLAQLLHKHRGVANKADLPQLNQKLIVEWVKEYRGRTNRFPTAKSGKIPGTNETWRAVELALTQGLRGLPGNDSLAKFMDRYFGRGKKQKLESLSEEQIIEWVKAHHERTGKWPNQKSGQIYNVPGITWTAVDRALYQGHRGLPGNDTLSKLVQRVRGSNEET